MANAPAGASVQFILDDTACGTATQSQPGRYQASCSPAPHGEHRVVVRLLNDAGGELGHDINKPVGSNGDQFIVVGDSISNGVGDRYASDNRSQPVVRDL